MKPEKDTKCGVCAIPSFERNNFFYGKQITVRDSVQEQFFFNEKRRLINRMVLGWGVVCGLDVHWDCDTHEFVVFQGLALDCCGREILVCEPARIKFEAYEEHCKCAREKREPPKGRYILCLEYFECKTEPVELPPVCCESKEHHENNRIRESFRLRIKPIKPWEHGQEPEEDCLKHTYGHIACIDRFKKPVSEIKDPLSCHTPTIHDYLCRLSKKGCPECECDCVVLGVVYVGKKGGEYEHEHEHEPRQEQRQPAQQQSTQQQTTQQPPTGEEELTVHIDTCTYRRLVYGNPLLYDLIYCYHGDLPHIVDFSWRTQLNYPNRELDWDTFVKLIKDGLTLTFDQDMDGASLNTHTFLVTFHHIDEGTGALVPKRIPAERVESKKERCFTARWIADLAWVHDELESKNSQLARGVDIEIIVHGSRVFSTKGKALDGEFIAGKLPTGNGVQGGDFVDWFTVRPRGEPKVEAKAYEAF